MTIKKGPHQAFAWAQVAEAAAIADLVNEAYRTPGPQAWTSEAHLLGGQRTDAILIAETIAQPMGGILLMREAAQIIGCVHVAPVARATCALGLFAVRSDRQASGCGSALIAHAEAMARQRWDCHRMEITVITMRDDLIAWYGRRGYGPTGEFRAFPYGDVRFGLPRRPDLVFCVMEKPLGPM